VIRGVTVINDEFAVFSSYNENALLPRISWCKNEEYTVPMLRLFDQYLRATHHHSSPSFICGKVGIREVCKLLNFFTKIAWLEKQLWVS